MFLLIIIFLSFSFSFLKVSFYFNILFSEICVSKVYDSFISEWCVLDYLNSMFVNAILFSDYLRLFKTSSFSGLKVLRLKTYFYEHFYAIKNNKYVAEMNRIYLTSPINKINNP